MIEGVGGLEATSVALDMGMPAEKRRSHDPQQPSSRGARGCRAIGVTAVSTPEPSSSGRWSRSISTEADSIAQTNGPLGGRPRHRARAPKTIIAVAR